MDVTDTITQFISMELLNRTGPVGQDEDLLMDGGVDSLGMVRLVAFIQESLDVTVPPEDFTIENFRTIRVLGEYLSRSLDGKGNSRAS